MPRERKTRDSSHIRCIQNKNREALMHDEEILNKWAENVSKILNETRANKRTSRETISWRESHYSFHCRIQKKEVNKILRNMKSEKDSWTK